MTAGESARAMATKLRAEAERWDAGAIGEERVGRALEAMDLRTTRVLHDRLLAPGQSETNLDHLVVSSSGVFLIDAKNWSGNVTVYGDGLWQHLGTSPSRCMNSELHKVREVAAKVGRAIGHTVVPVLCLAGESSQSFAPQEVRGVQIVPVAHLLAWLQAQPVVYEVSDVATLAVDLSCRYPAAVNPGLTMAIADEAPAREFDLPRSTKPVAARRRPRHGTTQTASAGLKLIRPAVVLLLLVAAVSAGPRIYSSLVHHVAAAVTRPFTPSTSPAPPGPTLAAARLQQLDDWRIHAGLYESNDEPTALPYVPDSGLGSWSDACKRQEAQLAPFRAHLLAAPDPQLKTSAVAFDAAVRHLLGSCVSNDAVGVHHARTAMGVAAAAVNTRYNQLLGKDPTAYNAVRVL